MTDEEVDQQIAANVHTRLARCVKEQLTVELQQTCETQDRAIKEAWQAILASLQAIEDTKRKVVSAYKTDLREKIFGIVTADLPGMTLPSYDEIAAHFANTSSRSLLVETAPLSPQASPRLLGSAPVGPGSAVTVTNKPRTAPFERSGTLTADEGEASVPNNEHPPRGRVAKRGGGCLLPTPRQPPKKRARTSSDGDAIMRTIDAKLVQGRDYIFRFPDLDKSWYVVRCNLGQPEKEGFLKFTSHPLENASGIERSPAMQHFRFWRTCKGHEAKDYTSEEIVLNFGYRVVDDELDQKWVAESNGRASSGRGYAGELSIPSLVASNAVSLAGTQRG